MKKIPVLPLHVLRCTSCFKFLSNPLAATTSRRPSGSSFGSLATGLHIANEVYDQLVAGHCERWYHQKEKLKNHLSSDTHVQALQYAKSIEKKLKREVNVVRNQLRTALGIVKSKAAARQYEERIAELLRKHGIMVNFTDHDGYYSAYKYICKYDDNVYHSPNHPNLNEIGSPKTKNCHKAYRERRSKRQVPTNEQDPNSGKKIRKLSNIEVSEFIVKNDIKNETALLAIADAQSVEGKKDLTNYVICRSSKSLNELIPGLPTWLFWRQISRFWLLFFSFGSQN